MASLCMPTQTNYQQFQLTNGNIMLLPNAHNQQQQQHVQQQQQIFNQQQQLQHIAPKTPLGNSQLQNIQTTATSGLGAILQKKKYTYTNMPYGEQIPSVARRNARERNRVKQVNNGFVNLRQHIPQTVINALSHGGRGASKKLSKVDTLRIAVEYIRGLKDLLDDGTQPQQIHHHFHSDESSNDGSCAYSFMGSPNSSNSSSTTQQLQQQQQQQQQFQQMHSYHSEQSTSPTPSYSDSDVSYMQHIKLEAKDQQQQHQQQQQQQHQTQQQQQQFKFEPFDSFSDDQGDDEELLDYISSWQEQ